jgi:Tol biopolymer transport system component
VDGSQAKQITNIGDAGTPRWSPDGRGIAFDANINGASAIFTIAADGGAPRVMVSGNGNNEVPSWSHDGQYLYFSSDRGEGRFQVWRLALKDGHQEQISKNGGFAPLESSDGKTIYYAESRYPSPHIWQMPKDGGPETMVSPQVRPATWASWMVTDDGIYFIDQGVGNVALLSLFEVGPQQLKQLTFIGQFPFWMTVSRDGKRAAFDRNDSEDSASVVELEDFH